MKIAKGKYYSFKFYRNSRRPSLLKSLSSPKKEANHRFKEFDYQKSKKENEFNTISMQMFSKIVEAGQNNLGPNDSSIINRKSSNDDSSNGIKNM